MWVIQLREPENGARYYSSYGKHVAYTKDKAKHFASKEEAEKVCATCTLWDTRKVIPL